MSLNGQTTVDPMRPFPMQDGPPIPWFLAEIIYEEVYRYSGQTLGRLAQRGGFGWGEVAFMWNDHDRMTSARRDRAHARAKSFMEAGR